MNDEAFEYCEVKTGLDLRDKNKKQFTIIDMIHFSNFCKESGECSIYAIVKWKLGVKHLHCNENTSEK